MFSRLLDFIFPIRSLTGTEGSFITDLERRSMKTFPVRFHADLLKKKELRSLDCLIAAGSYDDSPLLRKAIHSFKYKRIKILGEELAEKIISVLPGLLTIPERYLSSTDPNPNPSPVLCPVPLHWSRRFHRGFNQAEIIARAIARKKEWPVKQFLRRTRPTGHQAHRTRIARFEAMESAFRFDSSDGHPPPCVILVDDVFTTGATLDSCAKELKKAGAKYVVGLVVAQG